MSHDTNTMDHSANGSSTLLWILTACLAALSSSLRELYPLATFVLTIISIISFILIIIINAPKAYRVIESGIKLLKTKKNGNQ